LVQNQINVCTLLAGVGLPDQFLLSVIKRLTVEWCDLSGWDQSAIRWSVGE
jgi:hypothetical protein